MTFWLIVFVIAAVLEAVSLQLVSIWFAIASVVAMVANVAGASVTLQWIIFVATSVALVVITRPLMRRMIPKNSVNDRDIGKKGVVCETIDVQKGTGRVQIGDVFWSALPTDGVSIIESGATVFVNRKDGTTVYVETI